jgi:hypothetical protein
LNWTIDLREGDTSYTYTWDEYEFRPTVSDRTGKYLIVFRGVPLDGKPRCLSLSRRRAEWHATGRFAKEPSGG